MNRRLALVAVFSLFVGLLPATASGAWTYDMIFPLIPDPGYSDNFGDPRGGSRSHGGIDIMSPKMTPIVAVASGTIGWMHNEQGGDCCDLELQHDDGYESWYIHMNNDTPGTDDGQGWGFAPGISQGVHVVAGELIGWVGDSGNAENSGSHLHFELHDQEGNRINPYMHLNAATRIGIPIDGNYNGPFWDDEGNAHEANINRLADLGVTSGCGIGHFCPNVEVSRAQMATFIKRSLDMPPSATNWFGDDNGSVHEADINSIADEGITLGCGNGSYCPDDYISREHMAVFLARAFNLPASNDNPFNDISGNQYTWAIQALAAAGITSGCGNGEFCADDPVTRAQMATFLVNAIDWAETQS